MFGILPATQARTTIYMRFHYLLLSACCTFLACGDSSLITNINSTGPSNFTLDIHNDEAGRALLAEGSIHGNECKVELAQIGGRDALKISTLAEFSDAFIDLSGLFGRSIDFRSAKYFYFDAYVPEGSWIASIKFNHKTADGSFGGCGNSANNLATNQGRWLTVEVPVQEWFTHCKNWSGKGDFLASTSELTINPYNANRVDTGVVYVNNFRLMDKKVSLKFLHPRLAPKPEVADNSPYTITWDDQALLDKQIAWRAFEATTQHIAKGKFGNPTNAIRAYGTGQNRFIALLPDIEQMTGHSVNFHELDSLHFQYYLTPESAEVSGATLFITTGEDWNGIVYDTTFMLAEDFQRGEWTYFAKALSDLDLAKAREEVDVLAKVYELRLDLHYGKEAGPIEIWYDDIG